MTVVLALHDPDGLEVEPPGRRAGYPEARWLPTAVLRIARRHGIA